GIRARRRSVRGAFAATGAIAGASVAVVDDVMTTGATLAAATAALRGAGVRRIEVWAVARTFAR
ncbi:MAG: phosphoribosyltransferase family protein, partial [Casimicrobiaceae bacterium]